MKDAKGHGSNAHSAATEQVGRGPQKVPIASLHPAYDIFKGHNQQKVVDRLRAAIRSGAKLPPLEATFGGRVMDGNHRLEAYKQEGFTHVLVRLTSDGL